MDQSTRQRIEAQANRAPRITPEDIEATIAAEHYFTAEQGVLGAYKANGDVYVGSMPNDLSAAVLPRITVCVLVLKNGCTIVGISTCTSQNFDAKLGREIARKKAVRKIWPLLDYALRSSRSAITRR